MVQGELFREEPVMSSYDKRQPSFLAQYSVTLSLDKLVLGIIGCVVLFVLTFSFGVERGKRAAEKKFEGLLPKHEEILNQPSQKQAESDPQEAIVLDIDSESSVTTQNSATSATKNVALPVKGEEGGEGLPLVSAERGKYTVQLVTYVSKAQAIQELERLKAKGYEGFVIPSGNHIQICVGYFSSTAQAREILGRIRSEGRYSDAFVRPVVR